MPKGQTSDRRAQKPACNLKPSPLTNHHSPSYMWLRVATHHTLLPVVPGSVVSSLALNHRECQGPPSSSNCIISYLLSSCFPAAGSPAAKRGQARCGQLC